MLFDRIRHSKWFDIIYRIGVGIKGFDGAVELIAGVLLVISPSTPHRLLQSAAAELGEHSGTLYQLFEKTVIHLDAELNGTVLVFIILFLILHGLIKLVLVYCLLKKIYRAYPYGLVILILLLIIQVLPLFRHPGSVGLWLFTLLDVAIIYLVYGEYQDLREEVTKLEQIENPEIMPKNKENKKL